MVRITRRHVLAFVAASCLFNTGVYADTNDAGVKVKWGYIGSTSPLNWGRLDPRFALCSTGKSQSPINITKKVNAVKDALTLQYQAAPLEIVDDGITELVLGETQTILNDGHGIQLNFPADQVTETITWQGESYRLVQFHLHTPSETQWHGQSYPMEIHFVHQGDKGRAAVLAVLVKGGKENAALQKIINHLPKEEGKVVLVKEERLNPLDLMPAGLDHYSFAGSLTTPPCTEGLAWVVMSQAITASPAQIVAIRKAIGGPNARPVQPLNGRVITYTPSH